MPDGVNRENRRDIVHVQLRTRHNIMLKGVIEKERESKEMTTMHHDGSNALTVQFAHLFFVCFYSVPPPICSVLFFLSEPAVVCALDDEREP